MAIVYLISIVVCIWIILFNGAEKLENTVLSYFEFGLLADNFRGQSPNFDTASDPEFEGIPCSCCKTGVMRVRYPLRPVQQDYG